MRKLYTLLVSLLSLLTFSQSGTLDGMFGNNGKVYTGFGTNNNSCKANAIAVQPDGKIIVGGTAHTANTVNTWEKDSDNFTLMRYNANGSPDITFGYDGKVMTDFYPYFSNNLRNGAINAIKLQPDGKILAYGSAGTGAVVARYNIDGSIDTNFGTNGIIHCNSGPVDNGNTLVIQPDGKIVVLGIQWTQPSSNIWNTQFVIERYNENGSIDASFAAQGRVVTAFVNGYDMPEAIALQPDGKIVAIGTSTSSIARFAIARYTSNGVLDTTFDGDGKVTTSFGPGMSSLAHFIAIHPDGKISVAGTANTSTGTPAFALAKYNTNGSLDTSFDGDGLVTNSFGTNDTSYSITSASRQPDGKYLVTTTASRYGTSDLLNDFVTRRFNSNGTSDSSFGTNGKVVTAVQWEFSEAKSHIVQADGKILIAGYSRNSTYQNYINIVRYSNNGTLDATFDGDGKVIAELDSTNDECNILLLQPDNKLLAIGTKRNATENGYLFKDIALARYNGDGSLDASFGADGKVVSVFAPNDMNKVHQAVLQPDGKIVISNTYYNIYTGNSILHHELIRYTSNGVIDMAFGTSGRVIIDAEPVTMLSQPDGKIIVITLSYDSQSNAFVTLKRYNTNGLIDTSFGNNGTTGFAGIFWGPLTAALHPTGKIIIAESSPNTNGVSTFALTCFNPDGTIDSTFENDPMPGDTGRYSYGIFVEPDGKIIVAGRSTSVSDGGSTFFEFITARYNPDGSIDATYGTGGVVTSYLGSTYEPYNIIRSIVYQPDGKFLVALTKEEQNPASPNPNSYDFVIYRFNADGGYDSEFGTNGQVITSFYNKYDEAFAMVVQPDNKIVVAGTTDTGINRDFSLVRFKNSIALGSSKFEAGAGLILYPNPVKDILHLQATDATGIIDYSIYNMLGKLLDKSTGDSLKVDVSDFSSGIYNVHINTNKGTLSKKFVKE